MTNITVCQQTLLLEAWKTQFLFTNPDQQEGFFSWLKTNAWEVTVENQRQMSQM